MVATNVLGIKMKIKTYLFFSANYIFMILPYTVEDKISFIE